MDSETFRNKLESGLQSNPNTSSLNCQPSLIFNIGNTNFISSTIKFTMTRHTYKHKTPTFNSFSKKKCLKAEKQTNDDIN